MNLLVAGLPFLSAAWVAALGEAAASLSVDPSIGLVLQHEVGGLDAYWLAIEGGQVAFGAGRRDDATVTYRVSLETARAVARGERTATDAFVTGDLEVAGRVGELLGASGVLDEVAAAVAPVVREGTDFS